MTGASSTQRGLRGEVSRAKCVPITSASTRTLEDAWASGKRGQGSGAPLQPKVPQDI